MLVVDIQLRDKVSRRGRREIALACSSCVLINLIIWFLGVVGTKFLLARVVYSSIDQIRL